ncbi:MAG TPA: TolC family protein, partial [Terriglobales bacterium]|nr:TolC family protein [Terriglobales bacterium]
MPASSLRLRLAVILSFWWCAAVAQQTAAAPLRLADAVARAVEHYPAVIAAQRQSDQAQAAVALRRTDALPDVRWTAQFDRATDNNTPGLLLGNGLPTISGPVAAHYAWQGYTTSSGGAVLSWEAYDFGRRAAGVDFYRQLSLRSQEQVRETQLEVGAHAADVYLAMLAAGQSVALAAADVERWRTLDRLVHVLVDQQLRPGADGSRIDAELAAAELALARANDELARQQAALAEAVGAPLETMTLAGEDLLARAPDEDGGVNGTALGGTPPLDAAPLLRAQQFIIRATQANQRQLRLSDRPRFSLLASGYGRGTSLLAGTRLLPDWNGIAPIGAGNWLLGLGVEYSLTRHWQNKHEQAIAQQQLLQDQARLTQLQGTLQLAERQAQADLVAARQGLRVAPVELTAAETSEAQARARYAAGL